MRELRRRCKSCVASVPARAYIQNRKVIITPKQPKATPKQPPNKPQTVDARFMP